MKRLCLALLSLPIYATQTVNIRVVSGVSNMAQQDIFAINISKLLAYAQSNGYEVTLLEVDIADGLYSPADCPMSVSNTFYCQQVAVDITISKENESASKEEACTRLGEYWASLDKENNWANYTIEDTH